MVVNESMCASIVIEKESKGIGEVIRISGSVIYASGLENIAKNNIVNIGKDKIIGEIV